MEILTLLKANIRHKKGSFFSIILLMILISMSFTAIVSIQDNCNNTIENALNHVDAGNLVVFVKAQDLSEDLLDKVKTHELVEKVVVYPAIGSDKAEIGEKIDGNCWFMQKLRPSYQILDETLTVYEDEVAPLKSGEIYVTQGICTNMECKLGDTLKIYTIGGDYDLKIKGIMVEPVNGPAVMGWKQVFISDEDYDKMYEDAKKNETKDMSAGVKVVQIHRSKASNLSDAKFRRQLNLDTGIIDHGTGSLTRDMITHYTSLFPHIIGSILMVFIGFLMVVILIVIGHSISTGIEMDYVNLGILKSQGFTKGKIRLIFICQYLFAQVIGVTLGMLLAIPLTKAFGNVFWPIIAIPASNHISLGKSLAVMAGVLLLSALFIFFTTRKIGKIAPVRALTGGHEEIYFDSRMKAPIGKRCLSASLAFRQFTSNKRQYIGTILIVSILVFFMMTIMVLGNVVNSQSAVEAMGGIYTDLEFSPLEILEDETVKEIEDTILEYSKITKKYYLSSSYLSLNGEEVYCSIYQSPDMIPAVSKGRKAKYDNEIVITDILAEELDLKIGDKVTVSHKDKKATYMITGFFQAMNDTGRCFAMNQEGAKRLGKANFYYYGFQLENPEKATKVANALNEKYEGMIEAEAIDEGPLDGIYTVAIDAMKAVIYIFSVLFALIVVHMVCTKAFLRERIDIGIYKSLGFTSGNLRRQFAVRFLIVALIGSLIGTILCAAFSGKLLSRLLRLIGVSNLVVAFTPATFLIPIALICICFFVFSYVASRRMKQVEIKELVAE